MKGKEERSIVQRHMFADYLNVSTEETSRYVLMGTGFKTLNEEPGAKSESKKYVNEKASSSSVTSYETKFPFDSDLIKAQEAVIALYNVGRNHCLGSDAEFEYVRVELWNPETGKANEYAARKFIVSVEVSSISGESDISVSGNLNAVGDFVEGTFNTKTCTFTPIGEDAGDANDTE